MCRNIKTLSNFDPPATDQEVRASALQYVRKLSGSTKPSKVNEAAFQLAVEKIEMASRELIDTLISSSAKRNREEETIKAQIRSAKRWGTTRNLPES